MKITKRIGSIMIVAMFIALMAMNTMHVFAADPIVLDFSADDFIMGGIGGQGDMNVINDGDRRVLFAECTDGYDPDVDPDSTMGDLYASVEDFSEYGVDGSRHKYIKARIKNESAAPHFEIHFAAPNMGFHVSTSVSFDINPNSDYTDYVWNVEEYSKKYYPKRPADVDDPDNWPNYWQDGLISGLRLDFMYYEESGGRAKTGDKIYIEYIAFFETEAAANAFTFTPARTPAQIEEARAAAEAEREAAAAEREAEAAAAVEEEAVADNNDEADGEADEAADENNNAADSGTSSNNNDEDGNMSMIIWIIIASTVIAIIIVIVILVSKKK